MSEGKDCLCRGKLDVSDKNSSFDRTWCVEHTERDGTVRAFKFCYLMPTERACFLVLLQTDQKVSPFPGLCLNPVRLLP